MAEPIQTGMPIEDAPKTGVRILVGNADGQTSESWWGKVSHVPIYGWLKPTTDPEDQDLLEPQPDRWFGIAE